LLNVLIPIVLDVNLPDFERPGDDAEKHKQALLSCG
jgi:hypothetical protein